MRLDNIENVSSCVRVNNQSNRIILYGMYMEFLANNGEIEDPKELLGLALYQRFWNKKMESIWKLMIMVDKTETQR